jgi:integral membrane protein (TIGR01906 family)
MRSVTIGPGRRILGVLVSIAAAVIIVAAGVLPFLTPWWIAAGQERAGSAALTGYSTEQLRTATDAIVSDLVVGPPDFDVEVAGEPVLNERERAHMRDVRAVFLGLWVLAAISVVVLVIAAIALPRNVAWTAIARGARALVVAVVVLGIVAVVAFETLFEVFHRLLFEGGTYTFDPATERLVQLFPFSFWQETAIAVGVVIVVLGVAASMAATAARRRDATRAARSGTPTTITEWHG